MAESCCSSPVPQSLDQTQAVEERYGAAAQEQEACLCTPVSFDPALLKVIPDAVVERDYGCGDPTRWVSQGDRVLDLGSGSGKNAFICSQIVGASGRVTGVDRNADMLALSRQAIPVVASAVGFDNVRFVDGAIEALDAPMATGEPLIDHPDVRLVSFTGGTAGGRAAAAVAARQVKPVIMELGGKSPQVVLPDADLDLAVNGIAAGIFPAGGQSCISGSRLLVHREVIENFTDRLVEVVKKARVGDPLDPKTQIGPMANRPQYERVLKCIADAESAGHRMLLDGRQSGREEGYFIGPTIFADVPNESHLAQNEVFGPVVSTEAWETEAEAINNANATVYGLAAGVWSRDVARAMRIADKIEAGTVYINNYFNAATQSPVGGFKQSGYGRENGWEGMRCYLQTRSVWLSTNPHQPDPFAD